jgi:ATP-binding cassette subfamily B protein
MLWLTWKSEVLAMNQLYKRSFAKLSDQSMTFHSNQFGGSLVNQVSRFTRSYERFIDVIVWRILPLVTSLVTATIILSFQLPWFALVLGLFSIVFMFVAWFSFSGTQKLNEQEAAASSKLTGQLADSLTNIAASKSFARESHEMKLFTARNDDMRQASFRLMRNIIKRDISFGVILVGLGVVTFLFFVGGSTWFSVPIGTVYLAITFAMGLWDRLWQFNNILRDINRVFGDSKEMTETLDLITTVQDAPNAVKLAVQNGAVDFSDITFWHEDVKESDAVFRNFSLKIPAGQKIGLVGHSGSGKTTLTKLLLRFSDVQKGEILIDEQNIVRVTQKSLRQNIAYVPQEPLLFHRTIAENIAYGKLNATEAEIRVAAREANALEFIDKLPNGFATLVGERGVKLSGGQRQRIAIARAILADAPILVLDEATSALDTESEKLIQDALANLMNGRTSLVIAHRLSTVANLDRIIVLDDGKIIEDGPHAELLARGGKYAKLWNRQTGLAKEE